jgi:hypothetical protein
MRTNFPSIFQQNFQPGPFSFTLTDFHQSDIFVDAEWNISCPVDLEWACSGPIEMISPPYWLTNKGVDQFLSAGYNAIQIEFTEILTTERSLSLETATRLSDVMNRTWATGTF